MSIVARGQTLAAIRRDGLHLDGTPTPVVAVESADALGPQDMVVLAVKGPALAAAAAAARPLVRPDTAIVPMMNCVPWWFLLPDDPRLLASVDADGAIAAALPVDRVVGCVVHAAARRIAPNHVALGPVDRLLLGPALPAAAPQAGRAVALLAGAGLPAIATDDIRWDIWFKLWGNMTINPISALTRATADRILDDPLVSRLILDVMAEAAAVGAAIGCPIDESGEARQAVTRRLGAFRTSMLQDAEAGRPLEVAALLAAPREIAGRVGVPTPALDMLLGLTRLLDGSIRLGCVSEA